VCLLAANEGASSPSQSGQQNVYNDANSVILSPCEKSEINTQTPVEYQQLPSQTGGRYECIDLVNTSPYELLNIDTQLPVVYEQLAT